jgi:hypothetical protein
VVVPVVSKAYVYLVPHFLSSFWQTVVWIFSIEGFYGFQSCIPKWECFLVWFSPFLL